MSAASDLAEIGRLVAQAQPLTYTDKANELIRGGLPGSTFRDGGRGADRPGVKLDSTDRATLAEMQEHRDCYAKALKLLERAAHIEKVRLTEKPGLRDEAGWECPNYLKVVYGAMCMTKNHDRPKGECTTCRQRKHKATSEAATR